MLRGYDRSQVDEHLAAARAEAGSLRGELAESERRRLRVEHHAAAVERELRGVQEQRRPPSGGLPSEGFGVRAEKLMRLAEQEAADARAAATRDCTTLLENARAEAEKLRHDGEQQLIARSAVLDRQVAQRAAELNEREQLGAAQLDAARQSAVSLRAAAEQTAAECRRNADVDADAVRLAATRDAERIRREAQQAVDAIAALQAAARSDLARLVAVLDTEIGSARPALRRDPIAIATPDPAEPRLALEASARVNR